MLFQPGVTSAELRIPILDDSLGLEGTEDFTTTLSVFSCVSVTAAGNTYIATVSIDDDDETFVEFTPVNYIFNERERVVVLDISASDLVALNYSVDADSLPGTAQGWCTAQVVSFCIFNRLHIVPCAIPLLLHHVSLFHLTLLGCDYPSEQYAAVFSAGETTVQVAVTDFDDNATEGIENVTAVLILSEYTLSLGVRLNQNSSTAIINIEDNGESVVDTTGVPYCQVYWLYMSCIVHTVQCVKLYLSWKPLFPLLLCPAEVVCRDHVGKMLDEDGCYLANSLSSAEHMQVE